MPIYAKSNLSKQIIITLFNNLSTLFALAIINNYNVNYFVNRCFFRHFTLVYRLWVQYLFLFGLDLLILYLKG